MKTTLTHLPEDKQHDIELAVEILVEKLNPHMIILFGSHSRGDWIVDSYVENGITYYYVSDYDVLVVMDQESNAEGGMNQYLYKRLKRGGYPLQAPVRIIIHGIEYLNAKLDVGHYFFTEIINEGTMLYNDGKAKLATPRKLSPTEIQKITQEYFDIWYPQGAGFYEGYQFFFEKDNYKLAAFHLHQATESLFAATLLVFREDKAKTHNIDEMYIKVCSCDARFKTIFPQTPQEDKDKFKKLAEAYIKARYDPHWIITHEVVLWLGGRVQKLVEMTKEICTEKIKEHGQL